MTEGMALPKPGSPFGGIPLNLVQKPAPSGMFKSVLCQTDIDNDILRPRRQPPVPPRGAVPIPITTAPLINPQALVDPAPEVSMDRLRFLDRVEKIMSSEQRAAEIEAENRMLSRMLSRLQKEIDELKAAKKV